MKNKLSHMPRRLLIVSISIVVVGIITFSVLVLSHAKNTIIDDTGKNTSVVAQDEFESLQYNLLLRNMSWAGDDEKSVDDSSVHQSVRFYITVINEEKREKYIAYYEDFWPEQNSQGKKDTIRVSKRKAEDEEINAAKSAYRDTEYKSFKELIDEQTNGDYEYVAE